MGRRIAAPASAKEEMVDKQTTRFGDFDSSSHPFNKWWKKYGQFMMSGGGRREMIWAARGWIAREQYLQRVTVTGESESVKEHPDAKP